MILYRYKACLIIFLGFIFSGLAHGKISANEWLTMEDDPMVLDEKYIEALIGAVHKIRTLDKWVENGAKAELRIYESEKTYHVTLEKYNGYFSKKWVYFKSNRQLQRVSSEFYRLDVGAFKTFTEEGDLLQQTVYSAEDWVDRLVDMVKKEHHLDLASPRAFVLKKVYSLDNKRPGVFIEHLNGQQLRLYSIEGRDLSRKFMLFDWNSLKFVGSGITELAINKETGEIKPNKSIILFEGNPRPTWRW